jgi:PAS domain S-box-containing protein
MRSLRLHLDAVAWVLVAAIFALDVRYPAGFAANLLYVGVILMGLWTPSPRLALQVAGVASVLSVADYFFSPAGGDNIAALFNGSVSTLMFWVTALGVARYRRNAAQREAGRQRAQEYLDIVSVAVLVLDAQGRIVLINRRGLELAGQKEAGVTGLVWVDTFVPAEDRASWIDVMRGLHGSERDGVYHLSHIVAHDGTSRAISWSTVILRDAHGAVTGTLSSGEEITARVQAEEALRRSVKALEDTKYALDQSAIVATTDVRGTITNVNDKFCEISKYSRDELIGRNHRILNSGLHPVEFFKEMYRTIGAGQVWRGEIRNRAKDGSLYWVDTTVVPFVDEHGHPYQYTAIRYDITERKRSEVVLREQESLAQLGKMAAVVAHEVRNPLAGIRGALQVIGRRLPEGGREQGIAGEIITRIDTLNDIVQDLLQFARPRQPIVTQVSIASIMAETVTLLREDPTLAGVEIVVEADAATVPGDRELLKLVLLNLLINGAQAMAGRGTIRVATRQVDGFVEVRIVDEGPGIPQEVRDHLFEPFFTTKHRGTGLGLATVRRVLEGHRGSVELECPAGGGTAAVIRLPIGTGTPSGAS